MKSIYCLTIGHVDGETQYQIITSEKDEAKQFYDKYGHEGDNPSLSVYGRSEKGELDTTRYDDYDCHSEESRKALFKELGYED